MISKITANFIGLPQVVCGFRFRLFHFSGHENVAGYWRLVSRDLFFLVLFPFFYRASLFLFVSYMLFAH